jgi:hypothetical protein
MQRPYKRFSGLQWNDGSSEETPDHPIEEGLHQLEHKEHQCEK